MDEITFAEVVQLVDQLSQEERLALREHLEMIDRQKELQLPEQRIAAFHRAIDAMRGELNEQQLDELEWAMNYEFISEDDSE